ncbi:MAG TPA: hypothetical protein P5211_01885 [Anaerolineae bacterium]|nr:hypothetical protein [Anaerolineae bacterium]
MKWLLLSPPVAMAMFLALAYGLYRLGGVLSDVQSEELPGKRLPYAGGEDVAPPRARMTYHTFLRLALMFGILHVAALVVSTLPLNLSSYRVALIYLIGIGISVLVLTEEQL